MSSENALQMKFSNGAEKYEIEVTNFFLEWVSTLVAIYTKHKHYPHINSVSQCDQSVCSLVA